ncbi:MAG: LytR C-terminal domain-containing protein [Actinomycetaceae bacterium]|nr:LytR C-terminal domain-containing protein [Actinomycetaceae bacterium]
MNEYDKDEFDRLAEERKVRGAHRVPESSKPWWLALIAVVIIVPVLAYYATTFFTSDTPQASSPAATSASASATTEKSDNNTKKEKNNTNADNSATQENNNNSNNDSNEEKKDNSSSSSTDYASIRVAVYNGTKKSGLAQEKADRLKEIGFVNQEVGNYAGGSSPRSTTVYYKDSSLKEAADKIASTLGISQVTESSSAATEGIVVVLRSE